MAIFSETLDEEWLNRRGVFLCARRQGRATAHRPGVPAPISSRPGRGFP